MSITKILASAMLVALITSVEPVKAGEVQLDEVRVTCYYQGTTTASGKPVREGYVAAAKEHIGDTCLIYTKDYELIGIFECEDTGSAYRIKHEGSVDVYRSSLSRCKEWIHEYGDYLYVQWIEDANG